MDHHPVEDVRSAYVSVQVWQEYGDRSWHVTVTAGPVSDPTITEHTCYGPFDSMDAVLADVEAALGQQLTLQHVV